MKTKSIFAILCLLSLVACDNRELITVKSESGDVVLQYQVKKNTDIKDGFEDKFDQDGNIEIRSSYKEGKLDGARVFFFPKGDTMILENYANDRFHGEYLTYFEKRGLRQKGNYLDGEMVGEWLRYYENGQLSETVMFSNNAENGEFQEYYKNGKIKAKGNYKDGDNEHGPLILYDENGEIERKMDCVMGNCSTTWRKEKDDVINEG